MPATRTMTRSRRALIVALTLLCLTSTACGARWTDEQKLAAFRRTQVEVSARLRPFIEVALRAAGRQPTAAG